MPIIFDDKNNAATDVANSVTTNVVSFTPKFFDAALTGSGKTTGILNINNNPNGILRTHTTNKDSVNCKKRKFTNGTSNVNMMPINPLTAEAYFSVMDNLRVPNTASLTEIGEDKRGYKVYISMSVHSLILEDVTSKNLGRLRTLNACYQIMFWRLSDKSLDKVPMYATEDSYNPVVQNAYDWFENNDEDAALVIFSDNPFTAMMNVVHNVKKLVKSIPNAETVICDFITKYSLYDGVAERSREWQSTIDMTLSDYFDEAARLLKVAKATQNDTFKGLTVVQIKSVIQHIEDYNVPLNLYRNIYKNMVSKFDPDVVRTLCKQNLNLLLSDTLNHLDTNRSSLVSVPQPASPVTLPSHFSNEQREAITTHEPLTLVQAGAGTGKSTVILARIQYMLDCGVNPEDITVLSFTNAAADHILDKNPNVHSMTIASMIHQIYSLNFPEHELSSLDTLINALDIYYPADIFVQEFRHYLFRLMRGNRDSFTKMNNFVEENYDKIINILNRIHQTTLELEIIICYQNIGTLQEPEEVKSKYLIIDEVQDNSIFEFIYTLKYVDKHNESLFIVGDSSQTLYEFRASNPRALNVLEGSGVFKAYQLQINYRSNQEILDFANVVLADIEANQYANIQLRANNLSQVTSTSFRNKVSLHYERLEKAADLEDKLPSFFAGYVDDYINKKVKAGEQVAFLAYTRRHVFNMEKIIHDRFPQLKVVNLVPTKGYNSTIMSEYIKRFWNQARFIPANSIVNVVVQEIMGHLDELTPNPDMAKKQTQDMLADWTSQESSHINNWSNELMQGKISHQEFMELVRDNMLQFEIKRNAVRQSLLSAKNEEAKQNEDIKNADILLSTIHSAKGLEFQNTVVLYQAKNDMDEEKKRMYYVAFTRAMNSELVIAYDTVSHPKIQNDYDNIIDSLDKRMISAAASI
jgi:hypothetical protein